MLGSAKRDGVLVMGPICLRIVSHATCCSPHAHLHPPLARPHHRLIFPAENPGSSRKGPRGMLRCLKRHPVALACRFAEFRFRSSSASRRIANMNQAAGPRKGTRGQKSAKRPSGESGRMDKAETTGDSARPVGGYQTVQNFLLPFTMPPMAPKRPRQSERASAPQREGPSLFKRPDSFACGRTEMLIPFRRRLR